MADGRPDRDTRKSRTATRAVVRRIRDSLVVLLMGTAVVFVAVRVIPGDPTTIRATQPGVTEAQLAAERARLGLDRPIVVQYLDWLGDALRGDLGTSYFSGYDSTFLIGERLGASVQLVIGSVVLALLVSIPLAVVSVVRHRSVVGRALTVGASAGIAVPPFWLGVLLIGIFSTWLGWFPTRGYVSITEQPIENLRLSVLPTVTLSTMVGSMFFRFLRSSLLESIDQDYIRTVRGKGLPMRTAVIRHALPNSILPMLTFVGLMTASLLGGVVVVEYLFGWRGIGALIVDSLSKRDYAVVQGIGLLTAVAFVLTTLVVDLMAFVIDPRLRRGGDGDT